jgi:hypothetical protein
MNRHERRAAAKNSKPKLRSINGGTVDPTALVQAGVDHLRAGRLLNAQLCGQQAIAADANHADGLHLMGLLGRLDESLADTADRRALTQLCLARTRREKVARF